VTCQPGSSSDPPGTPRARVRAAVPSAGGAGAGVVSRTGPRFSIGDGPVSGSLAQPASKASALPRITGQIPALCRRMSKLRTAMLLILLEALGALAALLLIVWWTMFSGRKGGERRSDQRRR
jgi:hypothetical protein